MPTGKEKICTTYSFNIPYLMECFFLSLRLIFRLSNGHINFEKFWQLAQQISEFIEWKRTVCPFQKDLHIITFLQASPVLSEKGNAGLYLEFEI